MCAPALSFCTGGDAYLLLIVHICVPTCMQIVQTLLGAKIQTLVRAAFEDGHRAGQMEGQASETEGAIRKGNWSQECSAAAAQGGGIRGYVAPAHDGGAIGVLISFTSCSSVLEEDVHSQFSSLNSPRTGGSLLSSSGTPSLQVSIQG